MTDHNVTGIHPSLPTAADQKILTDLRRDFHRHPELGFEEHRTSEKVAKLLASFGIDVHRNIGGTGVVGVLQRGNGTRCIGLRADMDALPINERNTFAHCSATPDVMHACGHDGHTTMLVGAARHLAEHGIFSGRVIFVFQPAEEHGKGGPAMISDGLFDRFPMDAIYGMHNMPGMKTGTFAMRTGPIMASEALFEITISGQGGHAAMPHHGVDAIVVGAEIVSALQTIVSRKLNPGQNGVVSVTDFKTDGQRNVLPGKAVLTGDARALTPEVNREIEAKMRQIVAGISAAHGVTSEVRYDTVFEVTTNAPGPTEKAARAAATLVQSQNVDTDCAPILGSEDFAHMAIAKPGCFIFTGNGTTGAHARPLHSADYDFNDEIISIGSSFWVTLVEQELGEDRTS